MPATRRRILAAAAAAQSSLLGGCFGVFGGSDDDRAPTGVPPDETPTGTAPPNATENATETPTETPTETATATPVAHADLAAATTDILAEFEWFRTEYDSKITGFQRTVNRVFGALKQLESADELTQEDVSTLRTATTTVADYVQSNLVAHFDVDPALRTGDNVYVRDLERAINRGDEEMQDTVLARTRSFYQRVISRPYVPNEFSRRPVYGPLYDMLIPGGETDRIVALASEDADFVTWAHPDLDESTANDGVPQYTHEFPSGHRVFTHAHEHSVQHPVRDHTNEPELNELYAYGDDGVAILRDTASWRERLDDYEPALTGLFGPIQSDDRAQGVTLFVGTANDGFDSSPLYIERFDSVTAARKSVAADDESGVVSEGTTTFAGREWARIVYDLKGTSVYAYRFRAGATIVAALPSDVPWERRRNWPGHLEATWLAA